MKGIILAGGTGSRLGELSKVTNKHLLGLGRYPMIYHPIKKLVSAGITEIMIISGVEHMGDFLELLGSGKSLGCKLTYRVQDEAGGIAQALGLCEDFVAGQECVVLLGDNIFQDNLGAILKQRAETSQKDARNFAWIALKRVPDPHRYGVADFTFNNTLKKIVEKPKKPNSNYAVTGIYIYPPDVFDVIKTLKPSRRGELEITDVNNHYIGFVPSKMSLVGWIDWMFPSRRKQENTKCRMGWSELKGYWTDAGTIDSWHLANKLVMETPPE